VGKGGLPPLLPYVGPKSASGGKPPFPTCSRLKVRELNPRQIMVIVALPHPQKVVNHASSGGHE
jgi:hypothetical protein